MDKLKSDLHIHSVYSDGTDTPEGICFKAAQTGVKVISVTDHDSLGNTDKKIAAAKKYSVSYITGIELSAHSDEEQVHILGYGVNVDDTKFIKTLSQLEEDSLRRAQIMLERLRVYYNIDIPENEVSAGVYRASSMHIARALINNGYAATVEQAFERYLGQGAKAYCSELRQTPKQAIETILSAGGVAVVAHPGKIKGGFAKIFKGLLNCGLGGIEAVYSSHTLSQTEYFLKIAKDNDLIVTGGSDYHGGNRDAQIGSPETYLDQRLVSRLIK